MKHKEARKVYEAARNMTPVEELDYWRQRTEAARQWIEKARKTPATTDAARRGFVRFDL